MADFDVWIGTQKLDEMDWRADGALADDNDDEDLTEAPAEIISFLGFDPFEEEVDPDSVDGDSATTAAVSPYAPGDTIEVEAEDGTWHRAVFKSKRGDSIKLVYEGETEVISLPANYVRPTVQNSAIFNKAKQTYNALDDKVTKASDHLRAVAGPDKGPMGLTPEHIRMSPEYRQAKREYDKAAAELKTFSAGFVKQFAKELRAERADPQYHAKRQAEMRARKARQEQSSVPMMATTAEVAAAAVRSLKRMPRKMSSVQKPVNVKHRDTALNRTKPGMKFLHRTEEVGGKPAEMKVFAVKGGSIYYDEPNARKPGFYCDPGYFYSKVMKEWVK